MFAVQAQYATCRRSHQPIHRRPSSGTLSAAVRRLAATHPQPPLGSGGGSYRRDRDEHGRARQETERPVVARCRLGVAVGAPGHLPASRPRRRQVDIGGPLSVRCRALVSGAWLLHLSRLQGSGAFAAVLRNPPSFLPCPFTAVFSLSLSPSLTPPAALCFHPTVSLSLTHAQTHAVAPPPPSLSRPRSLWGRPLPPRPPSARRLTERASTAGDRVSDHAARRAPDAIISAIVVHVSLSSFSSATVFRCAGVRPPCPGPVTRGFALGSRAVLTAPTTTLREVDSRSRAVRRATRITCEARARAPEHSPGSFAG